jgi:hypothetical protein
MHRSLQQSCHCLKTEAVQLHARGFLATSLRYALRRWLDN